MTTTRKRSSKPKKEAAPKAARLTQSDHSTDAIHSRAVLVSLSVSVWTARRFDRRVTEDTNQRHAAGRDAGRYNKNLLGGDVESHKAVRSAAEAARRVHYENTLPWSDEGWRILPTAHRTRYDEAMRAARRNFESAVDDFVSEYPALREKAKQLLNGMYRADDYPTDGAVRSKFGFELDFSPVPSAGDFRLDLPAEQMRELEESVTARVERATADAMRDLWRRLHERVERIRDRLGDEKSPLRSTLIEDTKELLDTLSGLNVTNDADLESMRKRIERDLTRYDVSTLKANTDLRTETAKKAESILGAMSAFYAPPAKEDAA